MFYLVKKGNHWEYLCFLKYVTAFFLFQLAITIYVHSFEMAIDIFLVMINVFDLWNLIITNGLGLKSQVYAMILLNAKQGTKFTYLITILI